MVFVDYRFLGGKKGFKHLFSWMQPSKMEVALEKKFLLIL